MDLERLGVQFYADNYEALLRLCKKLTKRVEPRIRQQLIEDAMHEAMRTVPMAMRTYHVNGATLRTHVLGNVRWYVWKMLKARMNKREVTNQHIQRSNRVNMQDDRSTAQDEMRCNEDYEDEARHSSFIPFDLELLDHDEVESILARVFAPQAELLRWRYIEGMEFKEIAELLDCAPSSAHRFVNEALEAARAVAKVRD